MAEEKKILVDIEINSEDIKKANDSMASSAKSAALLTLELNKLKEEQKANSQAAKDGTISANELAARQAGLKLKMTETSKALAASNKEYANNKTVIDAAKGSNEQLRARLALQTKEYNSLSKEQRENSKEGKRMEATIKTITDKLKANEKAVGDNRRNVGNYAEALDGVNGRLDKFGSAAGKMPGPLGAMASGIIGATKAAIAFIATPLGLVLGAVALAIGAVKAAFTSSEEGQNKWNKIVTIGSALIGNFTDLLADFGEKIIEAFENPQKAVKDFSKLIKENIINRFNGLIELVPALGKSIEQLFKGNISEAAKIAADATAKVALGVENITEKTKGAIEGTKAFIEEQKKELAQAAEVADMRAKADVIERDLLVARAKAEAEVAELRLNARKEDEFTAEQRKDFLQEANKIQTSLLDSETEYLKLRADAQILENTFSKTNKENKKLEAEAIAALSQIETKRFTEQRQLQRELNTIGKQIEAEDKKNAAAKVKRNQEEIKAQEEANAALIKGFEDERALIDEAAELDKNQAIASIENAEERAEKIAFIEREALLQKIANIDEETIEATAGADAIGAVDEEKYSKQLAKRAAFQAKIAEMDRAARAQEFTDKIAALSIDEKLELDAAELSIDNEKKLTEEKAKISLKFLETKLALTTALAKADGDLTEEEIKNLQLLENAINKIKNGIAEGSNDVPTLAEALGITDDELESAIGVAQAIASTITGVLQIAMQANQERIDGIDRLANAEINAIQKSTLSEEKKSEKIKAIEKKAAMEKYQLELKNFKLSQGLQITNAIIGTAQAAIAAYSSGAAVPIAGVALGPAMAAIAAAFGAVQIGFIARQKPPAAPQFARGGILQGASHAEGGIQMYGNGQHYGEAEGGEIVLTKGVNANPKLRAQASRLNVLGGGVPLSASSHMANGGIVSPTFAARQTATSSSMTKGDFADVISEMPAPVVQVTEINRVQGRVATVSESANL